MKLKTLEDFRSYADTEMEIIVSQEELKQEAIKHIKEFEKYNRDGIPSDTPRNLIMFYEQSFGGMSACDNLIRWIKHFFNITEEELNQSRSD